MAMRNLPACSAISKRTKKPCQTIAMKNGKCHMHGGKSTGPKDKEKHSKSLMGNKNNIPTTGEFEYIGFDTFIEEEMQLINSMNFHVTELLDQEIQLMTLREYRMMRRIQALMDAGDFTITQIEEESGIGSTRFKRTNIRKETKQGTLGQIQAIEEALTRLQGKKIRLLELRHTIESEIGGGKDTTGIERFLSALNGAAKKVWSHEESN